MSDLPELPNCDVISNYNLITPQSRGPDKEKVFSAFSLSLLGRFQIPSRLNTFPPFHPMWPLTDSPISWHGLFVLHLGYHTAIAARGLPCQGRTVAGETEKVRWGKER